MIIKKDSNGKAQVIAEKHLVDHNELSNRNEYGAHSIGAIRNLPEKLTSLKNKDTDLQEQIDGLDQQVTTLETDTLNIKLEGSDTALTLTNPVAGRVDSVNYVSRLDNDTLEFDSTSGAKIKKVYHDDTLSGTGANGDPLVVEALKDGTNTLSAQDIKDSIETEHDTNEEQNARLDELERQEQGSGVYLPAYNFGSATPSQQTLTNYALQQLGVTEIEDIPDRTRVKNLNNNHLWIVNVREVSGVWTATWVDDGTDTVATATNTALGIVKGSTTTLKCSVDSAGELSVNGLSERLDDIEEAIDDEEAARIAADDLLRAKTNLIKTDQGENKYLNGAGTYAEIPSAQRLVKGTLYYWKDSDGDWNISTTQGPYYMTATATHCTASSTNPPEIKTGEEKILTFTADSGYTFTGVTPTATNATITTTIATGGGSVQCTIKEATNDVVITISAVAI